MNRIIAGIILLFLSSASLKAQLFIDISPYQKFMDRTGLRATEIQGTPYLNSEYQIGTVLSDSNKLYKNVPLRYDCFDDALEFWRDNRTYYLFPKETVKRAEFGGKIFVYRAFEGDNGPEKAYFEAVAEGKATLLSRYSINFYEPVPTNGLTDAKPARFDNLREIWYISIGDAPAKKVLNNKKLPEIFGDKSKEVETYLSKEKLSVKKKDDLKKLVAWYNSL